MKFCTLLTMACAALANPVPEASQKQDTVAGTLSSIAATLDQATRSNLAAVVTAANTVKSSASADVVLQAQATIKSNLQAVVTAMQKAAGSVFATTNGATTGIIGAAQGLAQSEIDQMVGNVNSFIAVLSRVGATLSVTVNGVIPSVKSAVSAEVNAVKQAIPQLVTPLVQFTGAASGLSAAVGVKVRGLSNALNSLLQILQQQKNSLGISLPDLPIIGNNPITAIPLLDCLDGVRTA